MNACQASLCAVSQPYFAANKDANSKPQHEGCSMHPQDKRRAEAGDTRTRALRHACKTGGKRNAHCNREKIPSDELNGVCVLARQCDVHVVLVVNLAQKQKTEKPGMMEMLASRPSIVRTL